MATPHELPAPGPAPDARRSPSTGDAGRRHRADSTPPTRRRRRRRARAGCASVVRRRSPPTPRDLRRGQPRLVAARDDLGARRPGRRAGRRRSSRPTTADAGRRGARASATRRASRSPPPPVAAACAGRRCRSTAASCSTCAASPGIRRRRRRLARRRRAAPARSATTSRHELRSRRTASPSGTGRSRWRCRPSAAGSPAAAPASSRPATARSRTWSSASTSCWPTARSIRTGGNARQAAGPDLNQLFVGSRGHARRHHRRPAARSTRCPTHERRAAYGFAIFDDGLDACRRILRRGATPAVLRLYDAVEGRAELRHRRGRTCCSCSTRAIPRSSTPRCEIVDEECRDARATSTTRWSSSGWGTATTCRRSRR